MCECVNVVLGGESDGQKMEKEHALPAEAHVCVCTRGNMLVLPLGFTVSVLLGSPNLHGNQGQNSN